MSGCLPYPRWDTRRVFFHKPRCPGHKLCVNFQVFRIYHRRHRSVEQQHVSTTGVLAGGESEAGEFPKLVRFIAYNHGLSFEIRT